MMTPVQVSTAPEVEPAGEPACEKSTATISIIDRRISQIPVKAGHTRFYIGTFGWTETDPYPTAEEAEERIFPDYRRPRFGTILALDVPDDRVYTSDGRKTFNSYFHGAGNYMNYVVGQRPAGAVEEEHWQG